MARPRKTDVTDRRITSRYNPTLTEVARVSKECRVDYYKAVELIQNNEVDVYKRKMFLEASQKNADGTIVERSWIGGGKGFHKSI